jgi:cytochrome c biogenesis protein CcmG, thiol:disulfide interchange protein DsbE
MNRWHGLFLTIVLLGGSWIWLNRVTDAAARGARTSQPAIDYPAPDFTLTTLEGDTFALSDALGKPVVLNFWATWCGPCQRELPALQAAAERYGDRVLIVGVDQGEAPDTVQRYVDQLGLTFRIPLDTDFAVSELYNVRGLPTTFFIDPQGVIRQMWLGEMNSITLAEGVAEILR